MTPLDVSDPGGHPPAWRWSFLTAIALLLLCGSLAAIRYVRYAEAAANAERIEAAIAVIDRTVSRLVDAETGARGYLLTGNAVFLEPYTGVDADVGQLVSELQTRFSDDPAKLPAATQLARNAQQKLAEMRDILGRYRSGDHAGAIARMASGKQLMDRVRADATALRASESSALFTRTAEARLARRWALVLGAMSLAAALALGFVAVSIERNLERRRRDYQGVMSARFAAERTAMAAAARLERSEGFTRSILDSSGDCIVMLEPDGRVVSINQSGLRLLETSAADVEGRPWSSLWGTEASAAEAALTRATASGEGRFHALRATASGAPHWYDVILTPVRTEAGALVNVVAVARDITDQKTREEERAQLLASEQAARAEAERAVHVKDEFVSTLSHELRTPLNAILGWIGILRHDRSSATVDKALEVMGRNARRQSQIIDDLLDMSRIMSGKLRLDVRRLDVPSIIEEAIASAQPAADAKGVRLLKVLRSGAPVQGDPGRIQQIIWNLVSNAIKFTPRGGLVQVASRKHHGQLLIEVSDTGQGIATDLLPHVFERFRQGDQSSTRMQGGLGLGLAIVKNLVEMHGGTVSVTSEGIGSGSTFVVSLPIAAESIAVDTPPQGLELAPVPLADLLHGVHALVVDDEGDARDLVKRLIEDAGGRADTAASAGDAGTMLDRGFVPDVIISDIGMPRQDGYEFLRAIRSRGGLVASVPAIALTALARLEDRRRALLAGYQTHLAKPVDASELVVTVATLIGRTGRAR